MVRQPWQRQNRQDSAALELCGLKGQVHWPGKYISKECCLPGPIKRAATFTNLAEYTTGSLKWGFAQNCLDTSANNLSSGYLFSSQFWSPDSAIGPLWNSVPTCKNSQLLCLKQLCITTEIASKSWGHPQNDERTYLVFLTCVHLHLAQCRRHQTGNSQAWGS